MKINDTIKQVLKETFYNYSFSTDIKDVDRQKLQAEFVSMVQDTNEKLKNDKKIKTFKFRQRKDSTDMFVWTNDSDEAKVVKKEELDLFENEIIDKLAKASELKKEEIKKFLDKNEKDAFEYLMVAKWLLKNK